MFMIPDGSVRLIFLFNYIPTDVPKLYFVTRTCLHNISRNSSFAQTETVNIITLVIKYNVITGEKF